MKRKHISWIEVTYPDGIVRRFSAQEFELWVYHGIKELVNKGMITIEVI